MKFLKNLKVVQKLILLITIFAVSIIAIGLVTFSSLSSTVKSTETIYNDKLLPSQLFNSINVNSRGITAGLMELMVTKDIGRNDFLSEDLDEDMEEIQDLLDQLNSMSFQNEIEKKLEELSTINAELNEYRNQVRNLAILNKNEEAYTVFLNQLEPKRLQFVEILDSIEELNASEAQKSYDEAVNTCPSGKYGCI